MSAKKETLIVGLAGRARAGKDYIATGIHSYFVENSKIYSFADDLKAFCRVMGFMTNKNGPVLQLVGTDLFRQNKDPNFWVQCLKYRIQDDNQTIAIIPDVRFPNEADFIKENDGLLFQVTRLNDDDSEFISQDRDPNHESEIALRSYTNFNHRYIAHSGNYKELESIVDDIVQKIGKVI